MTSARIWMRPGLVLPAAALALALLASPAIGQTPAAPASAVVLPQNDCGAKPDHPGRRASETAQRQWRMAASTYLECFKQYAADQRALAQRYLDAANAVIDDYNAAAKELQAAAEAAARPN